VNGTVAGNQILTEGVPKRPMGRLFDALGRITAVDVVLPTREGIEIRKRCITCPDDHQAILLQRLGLHLPSHLENTTM